MSAMNQFNWPITQKKRGRKKKKKKKTKTLEVPPKQKVFM
jgi:hypothetical protein